MVALAHGTHHTGCTLARNAKGHAAIFDIRTRYVEFNAWYVVERINAGGTLGIILGRRT